jgi:hypothetical protein
VEHYLVSPLHISVYHQLSPTNSRPWWYTHDYVRKICFGFGGEKLSL